LSPLRVAPGGRYFETHAGEPFLFLAANDAITWPGLAGLFRRRDLPSADAYLQNLAAHGVNCLRLMLEYAHVDGRYFERPAGRFNPAMVRLWDDLFEMCEKHGLRVLLAPWDNFWMSRRWNKHPYNSCNGGPAHEPAAFFTDEATIALIEARLRFVAARWGPVLGAWDLFNEIHPYWGGTPEQQSQVLGRWSRAIRDEEARTHGWTRPQTVSIFGPDPDAGYEEMIFRHPDLDFASTHIYHRDAIDYPHDTVAPALSMAGWTRFGLEQTPPDRPFTDSEHGPIALFNNERKYLEADFDDEYERHMAWAHLASGGCGSGMRWPARHPHILTPGMLRALRSMSKFLPLLDWRTFSPRDARADFRVAAPGIDPSIQVFAVRDNTQALAWLLRPADNRAGVLPLRAPVCGVPVAVRGMSAGQYLVTAWDTRRGCRAAPSAVAQSDGDEMPLRIEELHNDIALAVRRIPGAA
jgi:mannan endo-1,4-beta-mannosidase